MIPRDYRLPAGKYIEIRATGVVFQGRWLAIAMVKNGLTDKSRFGIITSTRISKRAVLRNWVKRIIRNYIMQKINDIAKGWDLVILTKKQISKRTVIDIQKDLQSLLEVSNLI